MSSGELVFALGPGGGLVVEGAGFEAALQDAGEAAGDFAQGGVVPGPAGAFGVVEGAGSRRDVQGGEGLGHQRVDEPVVADEPRGDGFFFPEARVRGEVPA